MKAKPDIHRNRRNKSQNNLRNKSQRNLRNKSLSQITRAMLGPLFRKQGFARQEIVTRWETIVGPSLGQYSHPERINFPRSARQGGTLFVRVEGAFALEMQHRNVEILEKLNTYFGYQAVDKIVIRQGPLPRKIASSKSRTIDLSEDDQARLENTISDTKDDRLKQALKHVGEHVLSENQPESGKNRPNLPGKSEESDN